MNMNKPKRIIWPNAKDRPKTTYLKLGFQQLGIPIDFSHSLIKKYRPSENKLGPYVYPFIMDFGEKKPVVMYDIGTNPAQFYPNLAMKTKTYFKIHVRKDIRKQIPNLVVAPNSVSNPEVYFEHLPNLRKIKGEGQYIWDFQFIGWHDDRGLRMSTVKLAKKQPWKSHMGLMPFKHHTKVPSHLLIDRIGYKEHLVSQALSKVCLALAGGFALPWCSFRHVELWGMGCCMITNKPDCLMVGNTSGCWIEYDLKNFVEQVGYFLNHAAEREAIAARGNNYFDKHLTPIAHARYFIEQVSARM
jgi:hypothetical protein